MIHETPIVFLSDSVPLAGRFYRNTTSIDERQPGILVTGSWLTVKEQMPAPCTQRNSPRQAIRHSRSTFRASERARGAPRQAEIPSRKISDITAAADFMATMSFVNLRGIGHLAICASAQYVLEAMARGANIRSFASVAGWFHDAKSVAPFYGGPDGVTLPGAVRARPSSAT